MIESRLPRPEVEIRALVPYERGDLINRIHQSGEFLSSEHTEAGTLVTARVNPALAGELAPYAARSHASPIGGRRADYSSAVTGRAGGRVEPPATIARCWRRGRAASAAASGPARSRWPTRSPTRSTSGRHLLVQAGTGTGKSLGYLAPALVRLAQQPTERIVVATATLALQSQLANNDIPAALDAVEAVAGERPRHAILKGRTNYACLLKVRDSTAQDQGALISAGDLADTIKSAPLSHAGVGPRCRGAGAAGVGRGAGRRAAAWPTATTPRRTPSGPGSRCRSRCASAWARNAARYGDECFVEQSRDDARAADLVVTNHALLAIDAMHGGTALPEHSAVIIDEAHELVARVTGAASAELTPAQVERVGRRALTYLEDEVALELLESADVLRTRPGRDAAGAGRGPGLGVRRRVRDGPERGPDGGQRADRRRGEGRHRTGGRPPPPSRRSSTSPSGWPR